MRSPKRKVARERDIAELREAHRILIGICARFHPPTDHFRAVSRAADSVRQCAVVWTGDDRAFAAKIGSTPNGPEPER